MTSLSRGEAPGEEGSIGKLLLGKLRQEMGAFGMELAGSGGGHFGSSPETIPRGGATNT